MSLLIKSPTRVDLAGGTLDCWPLFLMVPEAYTVNFAVDVFTEAELVPSDGQRITLNVSDLNFQKDFDSLESLLQDKSEQIILIKEVLRWVQPRGGFSLTTRSQSPVGGGLGGSSSLCISLMKVLLEWEGRHVELDDLVNVAHNIEARILHAPTGTQDYIPAADPGLHVIQYGVEGFKTQKIQTDFSGFKERMALVYTGRPHHSGFNNWQVIKAAVEGNESTIDKLYHLAKISTEMVKVCEDQDWSQLSALFQEETEVRMEINPRFTSPEIEKLDHIVKEHGAQIKICGAGGGGCVLVFGDNKQAWSQTCEQAGYQILPAQPFV